MKDSAYYRCYGAVMHATLKQPQVFPNFTQYFDLGALDLVRANYGKGLYKECVADATKALEQWAKMGTEKTIPCEMCACNEDGSRENGTCGGGFGICPLCLEFHKNRRN